MTDTPTDQSIKTFCGLSNKLPPQRPQTKGQDKAETDAVLRRVHTARYENDATRRSPRVQQLHACLFVAERAVTDGTAAALDRSQSRASFDFGSGRERFRSSPRSMWTRLYSFSEGDQRWRAISRSALCCRALIIIYCKHDSYIRLYCACDKKPKMVDVHSGSETAAMSVIWLISSVAITRQSRTGAWFFNALKCEKQNLQEEQLSQSDSASIDAVDIWVKLLRTMSMSIESF